MKYQREPKPGEKVRIYWNFHKKCFSVQGRRNVDRGPWVVIKHAREALLWLPRFKVNERGRQRVLRERKKNVHAFVCGEWNYGYKDHKAAYHSASVSYNPYENDSFINKEDPTEKVRMAKSSWHYVVDCHPVILAAPHP
jgi:hypothetical protein